MTTRFEMENQVIQKGIENKLERIADALESIATSLFEQGIHVGYLDRPREEGDRK